MHRGSLIALTFSLLAVAPRAQVEPVRVHVIGASVSGGFCDGPMWGAKEKGDSVTVQRVLKRWADGEARVTTHNTVDMTRFFMDPLGIGEKQVASVKKTGADIVVALDFPFWFAYGGVRGEEGPARRRRLAQGLALLADLDVPILLGDLPDMTGAAQRMLRPSWIPAPALLAELNEQLRAWAGARANVRLVELARVVQAMRRDGITLPLADGPLPTPKLALQQEDRLHATRLGMAMLAYTIQPQLAGAFAAGHPLRERKWTFERFVEAAGAEGELELLVERAAAGAGR